MPCERCLAQFTVVRWRRCCAECGRWFCGGCAPRTGRGGGVCVTCRVLCGGPARHQLSQLRVRDLQTFLHRRQVSTAGCVEKEDLINLVLAHVNSADFVPRASIQSSPNEFTQSLANSLKGLANNVKSALDIGSNDKSKSGRSPGDPSGASGAFSQNSRRRSGPTTSRSNVASASVSPESERSPIVESAEPRTAEPTPMQSEPPSEPPRCLVTEASTEGDPQSETLMDTNDCLEVEDEPDDPDWEIINSPAEPLPQDSDILFLDGDPSIRTSARAASDLDLPSRTGDASSADTSSLKDIPIASADSTSRINLNDLKDLSQVEALKVKQLKELLILNRVDFKGCCERNELLERAKRLWQENTKSREDLETANDNNELCKICMDAPIECVILECGHIATCINCGKRLTECPICRGYVVRVVRFFRS